MFARLFSRDQLTGYAALALTITLVILAAAIFTIAALIFMLIVAAVVVFDLARRARPLALFFLIVGAGDVLRNGIRSEFQHAVALGVAALFFLIVGAGVALAQSGDVVKHAYDYTCANEATLLPWFEWIFGVVGGSKVFSWLLRAVDRFVVSVPKPMLQVADTFAMNWVHSTLTKGPPAPASK